MEKEILVKIVSELVKDKRVLRINPLWVEVNARRFGYARTEVLKVIDELGYKKRHVMLYDEEGKKNTLICYVQPNFTPADKPLIGISSSTEELNELFARRFLEDFKTAFVNDALPEGIKISIPFFDMNYIDGHLVALFTREKLRKIIIKMWFETGKCTKKGVDLLVRAIEQLSEQAYIRKNTYRKNERGEHRARIEDKLIYKYTY